jgi:DNA-binding NtrC family response regulator
MHPISVSSLSNSSRLHPRTVLVTSADGSFRRRVSQVLSGLRWQIREAEGGAAAWSEAESAAPEAVIVDSWLPDLDLDEFVKEFCGNFPQVDLISASGSITHQGPRGPYRQELLYALHSTQDTDTAVWNTALTIELPTPKQTPTDTTRPATTNAPAIGEARLALEPAKEANRVSVSAGSVTSAAGAKIDRIPELVGNAPCMIEVSRRLRLVAPRATPVLIEGPTGSGKEIVAEAVHRLSPRSRKPFVAINCAAIPEALLEAELFGHTRGAFTGAVQGRIGRIESADGGTLFLDEIGEMPLALQAKLLRFVECCELQRVGDNEKVKVDVRIIAATHRPLVKHAEDGRFRPDLYYRLAVFLIRTPALSEHAQDLPLLVEHFVAKMGRNAPVKRVDKAALAKLTAHDWPGNVRELEHVLERAAILAGDEPVIGASEIDFGSMLS